MSLELQKGAIVSSESLSKIVKDRYILTDTCFLLEQFNNEEFLKVSLRIFSESYLMVEPLIKLEFLRDIYTPEQIAMREEFISKDIFVPAPLHSDIYKQIHDNALAISKIYGHNKNKHQANASVVDLILGARMLLTDSSYLLITANVKDFPSILFDLLGTIVFRENGNGKLKTFGVLAFSRKKWEASLERLELVNSN